MTGPTEAAQAEVARAIADFGAGRAVVLVDDENGYFCFAAALATASLVAVMVRHTSGYVRVAIGARRADRLILPSIGSADPSRHAAGYAVSVDAADIAGTGISASDRAYTIALLARADATPSDFTRPGHVVPVRAHDAGVLAHPGVAETALDLAVQAKLIPAGALAELVSDANPTELADPVEATAFAAEHGLACLRPEDMVAFRRQLEAPLRRRAESTLSTLHGDFLAVSYDDAATGRDQVAFVRGDIGDGTDILVAVHAECVAGELFGSLGCECADRLQWSMATVGHEGRGVVIYLRGKARLHSFADHPAAVDGTDETASRMLSDLGVRTSRPIPIAMAVRP